MIRFIHIAITCIGIGVFVYTLGCSTLFNGKIDTYDAGVNLVLIDKAFSPFVPEQYQTALDSAIELLTIDYNQPEDMLDDYVKKEIARIYADDTQEFRDAMFGLYQAAKIKVRLQIKYYPDLPKVEIIDEFKRGVNDALKMYEPEPQP